MLDYLSTSQRSYIPTSKKNFLRADYVQVLVDREITVPTLASIVTDFSQGWHRSIATYNTNVSRNMSSLDEKKTSSHQDWVFLRPEVENGHGKISVKCLA